MCRNIIGFVFMLLSFSMTMGAMEDTIQMPASTDSNLPKENPAKKTKKGWVFGAFPTFSFDSDLGFQFGGLVSIFYYGDGTLYPQYMHSIYAEGSWGLRGSGVFRLSYDSKYLIPKTRLSIDVTYLPEKMCDFFGFNGFESVYNAPWVDKHSSEYVNNAFYKVSRRLFRFAVDFERKLSGNFNWNAGMGLLHYDIGSVKVDSVKKRLNGSHIPSNATLYDYYREWGIISSDETQGGYYPYLRGGFTYDTRDRLINPQKGMWADAFFTYYAPFGKLQKYQHLNLNLGFRQYITLMKDRIVFAYRLMYQQTLVGKSPFYLKDYQSSLFIQRAMNDVMGGVNSLRGVTRNRAVGDGFAYANMEFRFRIWNFTLLKQYFYVGLNPLFDVGYIIKPVKYDKEEVIAKIKEAGLNPIDFFARKDGLHASAGIGFKAGWNENFVLSVEWAKVLQKQDGDMGFYILVGYLF